MQGLEAVVGWDSTGAGVHSVIRGGSGTEKGAVAVVTHPPTLQLVESLRGLTRGLRLMQLASKIVSPAEG